MVEIMFLGTGGGRFATILQVRATAGIYIRDQKISMHIDPGPGTLVYMKKYGINPINIDALLISHCHPDHYADAEVMIEAMSKGGRVRRGYLIASKSVIEGYGEFEAPLSKYHRSLLRKVVPISAGDHISLGSIQVTATPTIHSDPTGVGFKITGSEWVISYSGDTEFRENIAAAHKNATVLILATTRPLHMKIPYHMATEDAVPFIEIVKPKIAFLTHMGMRFVEANPMAQADWVWKKTGIRTVAAEDGMLVKIDGKIVIE